MLLGHPHYHSGGAEIAGNWPPAWVTYLTGYLKSAGYTEVFFVDAMTNHLSEKRVRQRIRGIRPDVVGCSAITPAITPAISRAERLLRQWAMCQWLQSFKDVPPRQKPGTFNLDRVVQSITAGSPGRQER